MISIIGTALAADHQDVLTVERSSPLAILHIHYDVTCNLKAGDVSDLDRIPYIRGSVYLRSILKSPETTRFVNREIRFQLYDKSSRSPHTESIILGSVEKGSQIVIRREESRNCHLAAFQTEVETVDTSNISWKDLEDPNERVQANAYHKVAIQHAPFLVLREDQVDNPDNDIPLLMTYNVLEKTTSDFLLQYTVTFSDEDRKKTIDDEHELLGRWGRRLDIEWIYRVRIGTDLKVVAGSERYPTYSFRKPLGDILETNHGKVTRDFKHRTYLSPSCPVLYNISNNNAFRDQPEGAQKERDILIGHHIVPVPGVPYPHAREWSLFQYPWVFMVSDYELLRENKLELWSDEYIYMFIRGEFVDNQESTFFAQITLDADTYMSGHGDVPLDRFGHDLWHEESVTAIPMTRDTIAEILNQNASGEFSFHLDQGEYDSVNVHQLRFTGLRKQGHHYSRSDSIQPLFRCQSPRGGLRMTCLIGQD